MTPFRGAARGILVAVVGWSVMSLTVPPGAFARDLNLSADQMARIGQRIWANECGGTIEGLTSWNKGEDFASLGIGHFIWYPKGREGPFEESFPPLVKFLRDRGVKLPGWLASATDCPWPNRESFGTDARGPRQQELRRLLAATVREQTEFIIQRLQNALPRMLAAASKSRRQTVHTNFELLLQTSAGAFAMIDYVNFKGDGINPNERYRGEGWGLLQVLTEMAPQKAPASGPAAFAESAKLVLTRRVRNSPPARGEQRWLPGWHNRCDSYKQRF